MTDAYRRKATNFVNGSGLNGMWNKLFHMKEALRDAPPGAWVLWVDSDVVFMNPALPLEAVLSRAVQARPKTAPRCELLLGGTLNAGGALFAPSLPYSSGASARRAFSRRRPLSLSLSPPVVIVFALRSSCWAMRFLDLWLAYRDWCAWTPLLDNGPFAVVVAKAMRGKLREHRPAPLHVRLDGLGELRRKFLSCPAGHRKHEPWCMDGLENIRKKCTAAFDVGDLTGSSSPVCILGDGRENRESGPHDGRGFNERWYPNDLFAHFVGSIYGDVRKCFARFIKHAQPKHECTAEHPWKILPMAESENCHPNATRRSWGRPHAAYAKVY